MAAHDLRNPLSVIQTASGFLLDDAARNLPEAKRLDFLRRMKTNSDFMVRLIDDLLDVAQIESGRLELDRSDVDLGAMIDDCLGLNAVLAEKKRIRLSGERAGALPRLQLDRGKIEQVLNNFVSNAIKFSQPDTDVLIRVGVRGDDVVVAVQDHGQGIPEAELDKLFKPFSRTSVRSTAGEKSTGLGLAIARKIVEGHGGRIWAESAAGKGSAFCFSLPMNSARQGGSAA
jgi:signal transduction histidine kinase